MSDAQTVAVDPERPYLRGKNADPEFRKARARKSSAARHSASAYVDAIVRRAPELTEDDRAKLRALLGVEGAR